MPGYTHLQRAQPVVLGHHLHAYVEMFQRDAERLEQAITRLNRSPLGAAALAGSTFPLDREGVAAELGFDGPTTNSMDGVSDRDFVMDLLMACAMVQVHISRLSEEVVLWTSAEFRFAALDDRFATGSSIMPQKKNADIAELARGKTGRVIGNLVAMLVTTKGLPLTYNKDLQEDKEGLFDTIDTLRIVLDVVPPMLRTMRWDPDRMATAAVADFALATDAADLLARHGVPFREAHGVVGRLVAECAATDRTFADLSDEEWAVVHPVFGQERPPLDALTSVSARDITGGTAPAQVRKAQDLHGSRLADLRARLNDRRAIHDGVMSRPAGRAGTTGNPVPSLVDFWRHLTSDEDRATPAPVDTREVSGEPLVARSVESDDDWAAVQVVRRLVFHDEQGFIGTETTDSDDGRSFQALATVPVADVAMGESWSALRVGDRLVVSVGRMTPGSARGSEATITWVATVPDFRGRGAAAAVMALMLQRADEIGAPTVRLSSQGHAVPFYRRLGFQPVGAPYEIRGMPHQLMARWATG